MTFGSLFAGCGGMDLGLERAGMKCEWQVEIDERATRTLERHWPTTLRGSDVKEWTSPPPVDVIAAGFPCQDISSAGKRGGIRASRSGLFFQIIRLVRESRVRPRYLLLENVSALLERDLGVVLGELAKVGYDAEWHCLSAAQFGAYHIRDRVFILAYPKGHRRTPIITADRIPCHWPRESESEWRGNKPKPERGSGGRVWMVPRGLDERVANGFSRGLDEDRLRLCGNAVLPEIAEWIGRQIMETHDGNSI